jgi:hypothetical protein
MERKFNTFFGKNRLLSRWAENKISDHSNTKITTIVDTLLSKWTQIPTRLWGKQSSNFVL